MPLSLFLHPMNYLFQQRRIEPLVVFRICFGFLLAAEGFGAILTGWVKETLVAPKFTFSFIDFPFLQPLPGIGMYCYFGLLGVLGLMIMLGAYYRIAMISYALLWTSVYLMQKTSYNNHYYLMCHLCWMMTFVPAHRTFSLDVKFGRVTQRTTYSQWIWILIVGVLWIVYSFASINKLQADWVSGAPTDIFFAKYKNFQFPAFFQRFILFEWIEKGFQIFFNYPFTKYGFAYGGILFDLLIIPALLWKPTRLLAVLGSIVFHLMNSFFLQIGIFPYLMLAFLFFFLQDNKSMTILSTLGYRRSLGWKSITVTPLFKQVTPYLLGVYLVSHMLIPLRHHLFDSDVNWSEEGHRLSWRMMLRSKTGNITFKVQKPDNNFEIFPLNDHLTPKQISSMSTRPDMIWQMAQYIDDQYEEDVKVFVDNHVSLNGRPYQRMIDQKVDLSVVKWTPFATKKWILPLSDQ